ncbi:MmyB family transcriptional regulator [Kitasatospora cineracea]|uniref:Helix-turn-helix protein n=1 Tax=Kitasatospora cineracea TaxID=88074 RepID=A0A3N4R189_9ACTN|nr:helix-turn-helix domain-containing protein [Kitasatospora cineracea]RPE27303.1 helix-turn-helix protein [Kitasatospora cineracea]
MPATDADALRLLLATRRGKVRPEDVGLPPRAPGSRGRAAVGLTQEQVDELTHRSPGTCKRFEGGRLNATEEYLYDLGRALRLSEQEWQALWLYLYGHQPPRPLDRRASEAVHSGWGEVLRHLSLPAYVTDQGWNVLAGNESYVQVFPDGIPPANTMEWMLLSPDGRRFLKNWPTHWAPLVLPQLRAAVAAYPMNETLQRLNEMVKRDPVCGPMYQNTTDAYLNPDGDVRQLFHWGLGRVVWVQMSTAEPGGAPGARLMVLNILD